MKDSISNSLDTIVCKTNTDTCSSTQTNLTIVTSMHTEDAVHEPVAYALHQNDGIVITLLFFLFSSLYIIAKSKQHIKTQIKHLFFLTTDHNASFLTRSGRERRYSMFLMLQCSYLFGLAFFYYITDNNNYHSYTIPPFFITLIYMFVIYTFIGVKLLVYQGVNYVFFQQKAHHLWNKSYYFILSSEGVLMLPFVFIMIFGQTNTQTVLVYPCFLLGMVKTLIAYKTYQTFFRNIHGFFHLIAYLCALEMLPLCILWQTLIITNKYLL